MGGDVLIFMGVFFFFPWVGGECQDICIPWIILRRRDEIGLF